MTVNLIKRSNFPTITIYFNPYSSILLIRRLVFLIHFDTIEAFGDYMTDGIEQGASRDDVT